MSGDVVKKAIAGEMVGEVVGFMHPKADWCHRDYSAVSVHCQIGGPAPVSLIRQSEAANLIASQAAEIERLTKERDAAEDAENQAKDAFWAIYHDYLERGGSPVSTEAARTALATRAETAERLLAEARAALEWSARLFDGIRGAVETNQVVDKDVHGTAISGRDAARAAARTLTNGGENGR